MAGFAMATDDRDRLIRVKMYVSDDVSPIPTAFDGTCWDANDILLAYMNLYRDHLGAIDAGGMEWEGVWGSPDCFAFIQSLIAEDVDAWL